MTGRTAQTEAMWRAYRAAQPDVPDAYDVVAFGDSPGMADELADLVVAGVKRATAGSLRSYGPDDPLPRAGDHAVVVDGRGVPRCVWRTTHVEVKPLDQVDDRFAWDEGEGDRTRDYWLAAHRRFFATEGQREGYEFSEAMDTVFERFTVVWPPEVADG
ncbi:MAG TPA: ASCH domain-containing protein [Pilimelia sp.]|nr:ASCH domain-containing protein [Pilimelia sp.]